MRDGLRNLLINATADVVGDRVYEPHAMTVDDGLPAYIIRELNDDATEIYQDAVTTVEVWPYTKREKFADLDVLADRAKDALGQRRFNEDGREFYIDYRSRGGDTLDEQFGGITKPVTFEVWNLNWLVATTIAPDPIAGLMRWVADRFPEQTQGDPRTWEPDKARPGIYWRTVTERPLEMWPTWTLMAATLRAHILTPDPHERFVWTRRLHHTLVTERRIKLKDGSPLSITGAAADSTAHPMRTGQITLEATYGVLLEPDLETTVDDVVLTGDPAIS